MSKSEFQKKADGGVVSRIARGLFSDIREAGRQLRADLETANSYSGYDGFKIPDWFLYMLHPVSSESIFEDERNKRLLDYASRVTDFFPTSALFPGQGDIEKIRQAVVDVAGSELLEANRLGITVDDVIALYKEQYEEPEDAYLDEIREHEEQQVKDAAYAADMKRWSDLSDAVGGDLFEHSIKLGIMRKIDLESVGEPWEVFAGRVIAAITGDGRHLQPDASLDLDKS